MEYETETPGPVGDERSLDDSVQITPEEREHQRRKMESLAVLAGGIAHDFNNLLMGVLGNADLALSVMPPDAPGRRQVEDIITAARKAADLADQMLAYSGRGRFNLERIDLGGLVRDSVHMMRSVISESVVLRFEQADEPTWVRLDTAQFRQVLINLVSNASEAIRGRSGLIRITTGTRNLGDSEVAGMFIPHDLQGGPLAFLEVTDTGCGIEPETMQRIFDPFFTTKFTGRGLGLAAVLGIVRGHGGGIEVHSGGRHGTVVTIFLPLFDQSRDTIAKRTHRRTILVIDDEQTVREVTRAYLEQGGYTVKNAEDGSKGLEILQEDPTGIDCVILDYTMPGLGGRETLAEIRKLRPDLPVILSSGYDEDEVVGNIGKLEVSGFIQKPYGAAALIERLRALGIGND